VSVPLEGGIFIYTGALGGAFVGITMRNTFIPISNQGSTFTSYDDVDIDYEDRFFTQLEIDNWWNWAMRSPASLSAWVPEMDEPFLSPRDVTAFNFCGG